MADSTQNIDSADDLKTTEVKAQKLVKSLGDTMRHVNTSSELKGTGGKRSRNDDTTAMDVQKSQRAIKVLFLGMTSVGKTLSIRTLQGKGVQIECDVYKYNTAGLSLQLIDTSGFDESPEKIKKTITDSVSTSQPHVIILVMPVGHFSPATKKTLQHVHYLLGQKATKHTLILFTRKDDLEDKTIETFIEENEDLSEFVHRNKIRFHAFSNRDTSDQRQVEELLQKIDDLYKANKEEPYRAEDLCLHPVQKKVVHGSVGRSNTSFAGLERSTGTLLTESDGTRSSVVTQSCSALSPATAPLVPLDSAFDPSFPPPAATVPLTHFDCASSPIVPVPCLTPDKSPIPAAAGTTRAENLLEQKLQLEINLLQNKHRLVDLKKDYYSLKLEKLKNTVR